MTLPVRRSIGLAAWRAITLALLVLVVGWDAFGLLFLGNSGFTSPDYDLLRQLTPWGMRGFGWPQVGLLLATLYALLGHRGGGGRPYIVLRFCLGIVSAWYAAWAALIVATWWAHHWIISDWSSAGRASFVSAIYVILARLTPTSRRVNR